MDVHRYKVKKDRVLDGCTLKKGDTIDVHIRSDSSFVIIHHTGWYLDSFKNYELIQEG